MRRLTELDPNNTNWFRGLSVSHYCMASILEKQCRLPEALAERQDGLGISERLVRIDSTNRLWQKDLKTSLEALETLKRRIINPDSE